MISVVVLSKNEEKNIEKCLENLTWCDELILVDDYSTDKTLEIAKKFNPRIFKRELDGDFASQRNFGLSKAKNEWVLFVDADEIVTQELRSEIKQAIKDKAVNGFLIKRQDFMWDRKINHGESGNIFLLRLGRKSKGKWVGKVHERWEINGKIGNLNNPISHYPHQSIDEFLKDINFYTDIRAKELFDRGVKSNFFTIIFYTKAKFIQNYFLKLGILDGIAGLVLALLMSFHSFLVRSKLWLLWQKNKQI